MSSPIISLTKRNDKRHISTQSDKPFKANLSWYKTQEAHLSGKYHATLTAAEKNLGSPLEGHTSKQERIKSLSLARTMDSVGVATSDESLTSQDGGSYWSGTIGIGTPPQSFAVDFDTVRKHFGIGGHIGGVN